MIIGTRTLSFTVTIKANSKRELDRAYLVLRERIIEDAVETFKKEGLE